MDQVAFYLERTLQEHHAARNSATAEERQRHVDLAMAYELRCLSAPRPTRLNGLEQISSAT